MKLEPRSLEGAVATSTVTAMEGSVKCDSLAARLRHIVGVAVHRLEQEIVTECIMEVVAVLDEEYGGFRTTEGLRTFCARLAASVAESKATICGPSSSRASLWSSHWGTHSGSRIPNLSSSTTPVRKRHSAAPRAKTTPTCEDGSLAAPSGPPNSVSRDRFTAATGPGAARPEDGEREHSASSADKHSGEPDSQRFRCGNLIVNTPATRATRDADSIYHDDALHPCAPLDAGCMLPASRDGTCSAALQSATTVNESRPCDSTTQYTRTLLASDAGSDSSVVSVFADSELSSSQATAAGPPAGIVSASIVSLEPLAAGGTSDPCAVLAIPQYPNFEDDEGPSVGFATLASKAKNSPHCSSSRLASTVSQNHNHAAYKRGAPQPAVPSVAEAALVLDSRDAQPGQPRRRVGSQPRREPSSADDANGKITDEINMGERETPVGTGLSSSRAASPRCDWSHAAARPPLCCYDSLDPRDLSEAQQPRQSVIGETLPARGDSPSSPPPRVFLLSAKVLGKPLDGGNTLEAVEQQASPKHPLEGLTSAVGTLETTEGLDFRAPAEQVLDDCARTVDPPVGAAFPRPHVSGNGAKSVSTCSASGAASPAGARRAGQTVVVTRRRGWVSRKAGSDTLQAFSLTQTQAAGPESNRGVPRPPTQHRSTRAVPTFSERRIAAEVVGNQPGTGTTCPGTPIAEQTKSVKSHSSCKSQLDTNIDEKSEDGIFGSPSLEVRRKRLKLNHALPSAISTTSDTTWGPVRVKNNGGAESRHKELSSARPREVICSSMQVAAECRAARSGTSSSSAHLHGGLGQNPSDRPARGRLTREERLCADTVACSQCTNFYTALASHASHERIQIGTLATGPQAATSARAPVPLLAASRHRVLQLPDSTPPGFWNLDFFPEEDEAHGVGCGGRSTNG